MLKALDSRRSFPCQWLPNIPSLHLESDINITDRRGGGRGHGGLRDSASPVIKHVGTEALPAAASGCNYQRGLK